VNNAPKQRIQSIYQPPKLKSLILSLTDDIFKTNSRNIHVRKIKEKFRTW
jgi:hypothetical protein